MKESNPELHTYIWVLMLMNLDVDTYGAIDIQKNNLFS